MKCKFSLCGALALLLLSTGVRADVTIGGAAPDFALPDQNNVTHKLADYKGKTVVLAFYPADMTPGCTLGSAQFELGADRFHQARRASVWRLGAGR